jgi:hypothetical protein
LVNDAADGSIAVGIRAKIPSASITQRILPHLGSKPQVASKRLQDVLPGADGLGVSDRDTLACHKCPDTIGDKTILCPISSADHIARPYRSQAYTMVFTTIGRKKCMVI